MQRHIESLDKPRLAAEAFGGFQFLNRAYAPVHAWLEQRAQLSLDEQVRKILVPEGIEAPPIEVSISLIKHETAADAAALRNDVRSSDIVIPELFGASQASLTAYQKLSDGTLTPDQVVSRFSTGNPEFNYEFYKSLYGSKATIAHVDVKDTEPLYRETQKAFEQTAGHIVSILRHEVPFKEACTNSLSALALLSEHILRRRNEHMLDNLAPQIAMAIRNNPSLQKPHRTKPIKVFMWMGAAHYDVPTQLHNSGTKVSVTHHKTGKHFNYTHELIMKSAEGKPFTESDGRASVLELLFEKLYLFTDPKLVTNNPFARLERRGVATTLVPRIFADVCMDEAEEIYDTFPGEILTSPFVGLESMQKAIAEYYNAVLKRHRVAIKREVDRWVDIVDQTHTTTEKGN